VLADVVGEEKELQHGKDDEQLDEDDGPEGAPQRHAAESVIVEMECFVEEVVLFHYPNSMTATMCPSGFMAKQFDGKGMVICA